MADTIDCPSCSAQFPYMPDMAGMRVDCPKCRHQFVVTAPRRVRSTISIPEPPPPQDPLARSDEALADATRATDALESDILNMDPLAAMEQVVARNESAEVPAPPAPALAPVFAPAPASVAAVAPRTAPASAHPAPPPLEPAAPAPAEPADGQQLAATYALNIDLSLPGESAPPVQAASQPIPFAEGSDAFSSTFDREVVPVETHSPLNDIEDDPDSEDALVKLPEGVVEVPALKPPGYCVRDVEVAQTPVSAVSPAASAKVARAKPLVKIQHMPREWTGADTFFFNIAIVLVIAGVIGLLLPLTGLQVQQLAYGDALPLASTLVIIVGVIAGVAVAFRQFAKWVFLGASAVLGLLIIGLFIFAAIKSPRNYTPAGAVIAMADSSPRDGAAMPSTIASAPAPAPATTSSVNLNFGYDALVERFGAGRVVRISVPAPEKQTPDAALASRAHENLSGFAATWYVTRQNDHLECVLAPVDDFQELLSKVQAVGTASDIDASQRKLTVRLP